MAEPDDFAVDAPVALGRVLRCQPENEPPYFGRGGWSAGSSGGLCPVAGDASSVPAQEGVGGDEPAGSLWTRECSCDRAEQGPVIVVEGWPVDLAA